MRSVLLAAMATLALTSHTARAQGSSITGHVTLIRVGSWTAPGSGTPRESFVFRLSGSARTFVVDLEAHPTAETTIHGRLYMASLVESAYRTGASVTIEYIALGQDVALVRAVQFERATTESGRGTRLKSAPPSGSKPHAAVAPRLSPAARCDTFPG